jgi:hypothetical protein
MHSLGHLPDEDENVIEICHMCKSNIEKSRFQKAPKRSLEIILATPWINS